MIRLIGVELRRLTWRRITAIGVIGVFLITAFMLFATWRESRPLSEAEQRAAQTQYEMAHRDWVANAERNEADCRANFDPSTSGGMSVDDVCKWSEPKREEFGKPQAVFRQIAPNMLQGSAYLLLFAAFLVGASFVAAEFSTGAIGNWLTFEPRRLRVYGSKMAAAGLWFVPLGIAVTGVLTLGIYLITARLGSTAGTDWSDIVGLIARVVTTTAIGAVIGGVVGLVLRHTAAALGLAMGYIVLVEGIFASFLQNAQPWLLVRNFDAFVLHDTRYVLNKCVTQADGNYVCNQIEKTLTFEHGAWYLGILTLVALLGAGLIFQRRDVN
ncbi:ABC transporter permease [Kribbella sandramycini]|uniref:ABC transporter permease n=1 Tax=Kribbella sandramycini TaxID=60450 RepID=A0A7Y4L3M7_9ACTN|nr:ABC transporter permease [Kribbella sandramycini]MBB6566522.1 ABC-2 type transport system permease protein [Kribbella sandramycini]NOL42821.1 ABC transporter permease [Kribbella sandramycini]